MLLAIISIYWIERNHIWKLDDDYASSRNSKYFIIGIQSDRSEVSKTDVHKLLLACTVVYTIITRKKKDSDSIRAYCVRHSFPLLEEVERKKTVELNKQSDCVLCFFRLLYWRSIEVIALTLFIIKGQ